MLCRPGVNGWYIVWRCFSNVVLFVLFSLVWKLVTIWNLRWFCNRLNLALISHTGSESWFKLQDLRRSPMPPGSTTIKVFIRWVRRAVQWSRCVVELSSLNIEPHRFLTQTRFTSSSTLAHTVRIANTKRQCEVLIFFFISLNAMRMIPKIEQRKYWKY